MRGAPVGRYAVRPPETASMHARDGVRLDADIYRPDAPGDFPILLMRQPYGRAIASTVVSRRDEASEIRPLVFGNISSVKDRMTVRHAYPRRAPPRVRKNWG
jgi:predicted acyl esterase